MVNWRLMLSCFLVAILSFAFLVVDIQAQNLEYQAENYEAAIIPTIDGVWTTPDEWSDAEEYQLEGSLDVIFRLKKVTNGIGQLETLYFLIEFFNDTTIDPEDYSDICLAGADTTGGVPEGAEAPDENCIQFEWRGHNEIKYFRGLYDGWMPNSTYTWDTDIFIVDSLDSSPLSSQPHLIVEWRISVPAFNINPNFLLRVAAYDKINGWYGSQIWPYAHVMIPDQWGVMVMHSETIPEISLCTVILMFLVTPIIITLVRKSQKNKI